MTEKKILVIDDEPQTRKVFSEFLTGEGFSVTAASGGQDLSILSTANPDIILLDINMPGMDGISVLKAIKATNPELPVIMITAHADLKVAEEVIKLGAQDFVLKPPDFDDLLLVINRALSSKSGTILVVDDSSMYRKVLTGILVKEGYQVSTANNGSLALASVAAQRPELILLDIVMPGIDGFEVLRRLREREESRDIPVLFLSSETEAATRVKGLKLGAMDFIDKPFQPEELLVRVKTHLELYQLKNRMKQDAAMLIKANDQLHREIEERKKAEEEKAQLIIESYSREIELMKYREKYNITQQEKAFTKELKIIKDDLFLKKIDVVNNRGEAVEWVIDLYYKPLDIMSGDSYSVREIEKGKVLIYLADAMGKGLAASVTSILSTSFVNHLVTEAKDGSGFDFREFIGFFSGICG